MKIEDKLRVMRVTLVWIIGIVFCVLIESDVSSKNSFLGLMAIILSVAGAACILSYVFKFSIRMFLFN